MVMQKKKKKKTLLLFVRLLVLSSWVFGVFHFHSAGGTKVFVLLNFNFLFQVSEKFNRISRKRCYVVFYLFSTMIVDKVKNYYQKDTYSLVILIDVDFL